MMMQGAPGGERVLSTGVDWRPASDPLYSATMRNKNIIKELCLSYAMELETVQNYIAASVNRVEREALELLKKRAAASKP
jgi:hypothetical protein